MGLIFHPMKSVGPLTVRRRMVTGTNNIRNYEPSRGWHFACKQSESCHSVFLDLRGAHLTTHARFLGRRDFTVNHLLWAVGFHIDCIRHGEEHVEVCRAASVARQLHPVAELSTSTSWTSAFEFSSLLVLLHYLPDQLRLPLDRVELFPRLSMIGA